MCFSSPSVAKVATPIAAATSPDYGVTSAAANQRNIAAEAYGAEQTILTGSQGLKTQASTTNKTLLGG
jgi:hypothetical protein